MVAADQMATQNLGGKECVGWEGWQGVVTKLPVLFEFEVELCR